MVKETLVPEEDHPLIPGILDNVYSSKNNNFHNILSL